MTNELNPFENHLFSKNSNKLNLLIDFSDDDEFQKSGKGFLLNFD